MTVQFDYYYLQHNVSDSWATLGQSEDANDIVRQLSQRLETPVQAEIRIVGAQYDEATDDWIYQQLFYLDQSGIELDTASLVTVEHDALTAISDARSGEAETDERLTTLESGATPLPAAGSVGERRIYREQEQAPWSPGDDDSPTRLRPPPAPAARSGGFLFFTLIAVFVVLLIVVGSLVYTGHPAITAVIDHLGLGDHIRLGSTQPDPEPTVTTPVENAASPDAPDTAQTEAETLVRIEGIAPELIGRWSRDDCASNYFEFTATAYRQVNDGRPIASPHRSWKPCATRSSSGSGYRRPWWNISRKSPITT